MESRQEKALRTLKEHLQEEDVSFYLWSCIAAFEHEPFRTAGRGEREGVPFTYEVTRTAGRGGRQYPGTPVPGYGNELWIIGADGQRREKSISRSTVDLAFQNARKEQEEAGFVAGPRKLGVPGVRSNLYGIFLQFQVIRREPS